MTRIEELEHKLKEVEEKRDLACAEATRLAEKLERLSGERVPE